MKFHQKNNQAQELKGKAEKGDWRNQQIEQQFSSREPNNNSANGSSVPCFTTTATHLFSLLPLAGVCRSLPFAQPL